MAALHWLLTPLYWQLLDKSPVGPAYHFQQHAEADPCSPSWLQGAPFGFTPFCDNNKDMEGFRFWKQGFWKEHLRGKPYHISALFVVDLGRFRQGPALYPEHLGRRESAENQMQGSSENLPERSS